MTRIVNTMLWIIYVALLGVLLPHTAWAFQQFEPSGALWIGWVAAIAFEGAIAAFTWRFKEQLESAPNSKKFWVRARRRYMTWPAVGLLVALVVSSAANWAHAEEFGRTMAVFGRYGINPLWYSLAFGAILPACSFLFAHILAEVQAGEEEADPELARAKAQLAEVRRELRETSQRLAQAEARASESETRFAAAGDLFARIMSESKRDRILAVRDRWPALPPAALAIIAEASPSYVSEVLNS